MANLLYQIPTCLQRLYKGVVWRMNPSSKVVYLTFDDGPIPQCTPQVLDLLAHYGVKATFFMVADNALRYPHLFERVRQEGHTIGNHTFHHLRGYQTTLANYLADTKQAADILQTALFRPPHGRMSKAQKAALLQQGYTIYLWDVLTHDYNPRYSVQKICSIVQQYTRNGSIIVFHDSLKSSDRLLHALPLVIEWLLAQGYDIQPLPQ